MQGIRDAIIIAAGVTVLVVGGIWASNHVSTGCLDLGFYKSCGVVTH